MFEQAHEGAQTSLARHTDAGDLSFMIALVSSHTHGKFDAPGRARECRCICVHTFAVYEYTHTRVRVRAHTHSLALAFDAGRRGVENDDTSACR